MSGRLYPVCLAVLLLAASCGQGGGRHGAPVQMISSSSPASGSAFLQGVSAQYCGAAGDVFILAVRKGYFLDFSSREWTMAPSPDGRTLTGAGGAAGPDGRFYVAGGVDRDVFTRALGLGPEEFHAYMLRKPSYYRFCDRMYAFDPRSGEWSLVYRDSRLAKAGAATGFHGPDMIIAGGEVKPGIRTPEAYQLSIGK